MSIKPIEVFQFLKPDINWVAVNREYCLQGFGCEPELYMKGWRHKQNDCTKQNRFTYDLSALDIDYTGDWKDSLVSREDYEKYLELPRKDSDFQETLLYINKRLGW